MAHKHARPPLPQLDGCGGGSEAGGGLLACHGGALGNAGWQLVQCGLLTATGAPITSLAMQPAADPLTSQPSAASTAGGGLLAVGADNGLIGRSLNPCSPEPPSPPPPCLPCFTESASVSGASRHARRLHSRPPPAVQAGSRSWSSTARGGAARVPPIIDRSPLHNPPISRRSPVHSSAHTPCARPPLRRCPSPRQQARCGERVRRARLCSARPAVDGAHGAALLLLGPRCMRMCMFHVRCGMWRRCA